MRWFSFLANRIFKKKLVVTSQLLLQLFFAFYLPIYLSICIVGVFCGFADFLYPLTVSVLSVVFQFCVSVFLFVFFFPCFVLVVIIVVVVVACSFGN